MKKSALASLREYSHTLELGLQILLQQPEYADRTAKLATDPYQRNQLGIILFGSDWGLCGQFNQQIAQYLDRYLSDPPMAIADQRQIAVGGARPIPTLQDLGVQIDETFGVPSNVDGITATEQDLLLMIDRWQRAAGCDRILLFYN